MGKIRTRRLINVDGKSHIVWFGSYGKNEDGTAKFYNPNNKNDNYSTEQQAVIDALNQMLSVIKGELWYNTEVGIPLLDRGVSKGIIDAYIIKTILKHPLVLYIVSLNSKQEGSTYLFNASIMTRYGELQVGSQRFDLLQE